MGYVNKLKEINNISEVTMVVTDLENLGLNKELGPFEKKTIDEWNFPWCSDTKEIMEKAFQLQIKQTKQIVGYVFQHYRSHLICYSRSGLMKDTVALDTDYYAERNFKILNDGGVATYQV